MTDKQQTKKKHGIFKTKETAEKFKAAAVKAAEAELARQAEKAAAAAETEIELEEV